MSKLNDVRTQQLYGNDPQQPGNPPQGGQPYQQGGPRYGQPPYGQQQYNQQQYAQQQYNQQQYAQQRQAQIQQQLQPLNEEYRQELSRHMPCRRRAAVKLMIWGGVRLLNLIVTMITVFTLSWLFTPGYPVIAIGTLLCNTCIIVALGIGIYAVRKWCVVFMMVLGILSAISNLGNLASFVPYFGIAPFLMVWLLIVVADGMSMALCSGVILGDREYMALNARLKYLRRARKAVVQMVNSQYGQQYQQPAPGNPAYGQQYQQPAPGNPAYGQQYQQPAPGNPAYGQQYQQPVPGAQPVPQQSAPQAWDGGRSYQFEQPGSVWPDQQPAGEPAAPQQPVSQQPADAPAAPNAAENGEAVPSAGR